MSRETFEQRADSTERRNFANYGGEIELRIEDGDDVPPRIEGHAAVFDKESEGLPFIEIVDRGAFTDTVLQDEVVALFNHDKNFVLGRKSARTLKVEEDGNGLRFEITPPDTQIGRDVVTNIRRKDVRGASFGFQTLEDRWEEDGDRLVRHLMKVRLIDVSPATFPAYPSTTVAARSLDRWKEENGRAVAAENGGWQLDIAKRRLEIEESI